VCISWMPNFYLIYQVKTPRFATVAPTRRLNRKDERHTMSATLTSGTYREPFVSSALRQFMAGLFGATARPQGRAALVRQRAREANEVRELARSVETDSPGF